MRISIFKINLPPEADALIEINSILVIFVFPLASKYAIAFSTAAWEKVKPGLPKKGSIRKYW